MAVGERPRVLIVGGGFAGIAAAKAIAGAPVEITLVDPPSSPMTAKPES